MDGRHEIETLAPRARIALDGQDRQYFELLHELFAANDGNDRRSPHDARRQRLIRFPSGVAPDGLTVSASE